MRPEVPDAKPGGSLQQQGRPREPWEYDMLAAKYHAMFEFIKRSGDLSDTSDTFKNFEAKFEAVNEATGYDNSIRLSFYRKYRRMSPDRMRMARNEIVRLLSEPIIKISGSDLLNSDVKEPGIIGSIILGAKRMIGLAPKEQQGVSNAVQQH